MKKTLLFISILLALFFVLTGCSGTPESTNTENSETSITPDPDPDPDTPPLGGTSTGPTSPFSVGQPAVWVKMTVTLNDGITFKEIEGEKDVTSWFKGLPEGVKAWTDTVYTEGSSGEKTKAAAEKDGKGEESTSRDIAVIEGGRTLKFKFTGTVGNEPSEKFALVIPSGFTSAGHDIAIEIKAGQSIIVDNRIKVTFDLGGGTLEGRPSTWVVNLASAGKVEDPGTPAREGYDFVAWIKDGDSNYFNFYTTVSENITIRAVWNPTNPLPPTYEVVSSDDYETTVRVHKNNYYGRVFYTLDGKDPVADKDKCRYSDSRYFDLTVQNGTVIRALTRKVDGSGKVSAISEHETERVLDYYGYGTETKSPRESTLTSLTYPPRDRKIATFTPGVCYLTNIGESAISEPSEYKNGENDFHIFNIFDCGDGRLLVVAKYGYNGVTTSNRKIFYYYIEKTTGNKTSDPPVEISGLSGVADNNFLYHTEYVQLIGNKLYFACDYQTKPAVCSYNLETKEVKKIIYDSTYSYSIVIADTFTYGTRMYLLGNTGDECHVWGLDTEDEVSWIHMNLSSGDKGLKGASDGSFLYVVLNEGDSSASGYNKKKLVKATLSGSSSENSTCYLETQYCVDSNGSISIGDVAVVNGSLLIAGSEGRYETTGTRLQVKRPCIWTSDGKETILLEKTDFPISCGYITPHTIQVLDGKVYILTDNHYDAYGGSNLPYYTETVHGGVIEMDSRRIWDFGNGFYYGALYTRVNYFYIKTN